MSQSSKNSPSREEASAKPAGLLFEAVEPRVLFSATAIDPVEVPEGAHHSLPQVQVEASAMQQETPAASTSGNSAIAHPGEDAIIEGLNYQASNLEGTQSTQVVFVSAGLFDEGYLADNLDPAYEVFLIEPGSDAVAQIASVLEGRTDIDAIHLIGQGQEGRLLLGDTELNAESIQGQHRTFLEAIGSTLSDDAAILIYGCDFTGGEAGIHAAALLSSVTGADFVSSDTISENAELGGDRIIENHFGEIEAEAIAQTSWEETEQEEASTSSIESPNDILPATVGEAEVATPLSGGETLISDINAHTVDMVSHQLRQIVFISTSVVDYEHIIENINPGFEVYLIDAESDGVEQIARALEGSTGVDAIHLISHGSEGRLFLGNSVLDAESMRGVHALWLDAISQSLSQEADIFVYGCDFTSGELGFETAALLAAVTGADVAASNDGTGSSDLGGDWDLETQ